MVVAFKPLVYRFIDCTNYHAGLLHFEVKEAVICVFVITAITNFFRFFPLLFLAYWGFIPCLQGA